MKKLFSFTFAIIVLMGCTSDSGSQDLVDELVPPEAIFAASQTSPNTGEIVRFTDESNHAQNYNWTFNGGTPETSSDKNPNVTYATEGVYSVSLKVTNDDGEDTETKADYITVSRIETPPMAAFNSAMTDIETGESIQFTDESTNAPTSWLWHFPGGSPATSTEQNPLITYHNAGIYSVTLTVTNADGEDIELKTDLVIVTETAGKPAADFTTSVRTITSGQQIDFTDQSTNMPTQWEWSFDGGIPAISTAQNPTVRYNNFGVYGVTLIATNAAGTDTETKTGYITVNQQTASYTVTFKSNWNSTNHPTDFPSGDHFSAAVGMVHKAGIRFFVAGELASLGIKDVAEVGQNGAISDEIDGIVTTGGALNYVNGGSLSHGTSEVSFTINVTEEFSLVTLVSMIAPSPDWFVAIEDVNLFSEGAFITSLAVDGISYNAGTDSGSSFYSPDNATVPAQPIFEIIGAPLGNGTQVDPTVAIFTFVKN